MVCEEPTPQPVALQCYLGIILLAVDTKDEISPHTLQREFKKSADLQDRQTSRGDDSKRT